MMKSGAVGHFEMLRDALRAFSAMAETMIYTSKKYNMSFNALGANLSDSAGMKALASEMRPRAIRDFGGRLDRYDGASRRFAELYELRSGSDARIQGRVGLGRSQI